MIKHQSGSAEHHLPTHEQTHASHYVADSHCVPTAQRSEPQLFPGQSSVCRDSSLCLRLLPCASKTSHQKHHLLDTAMHPNNKQHQQSPFLPDSILFTFSLTQLKIWMRFYRRDKNVGWGMDELFQVVYGSIAVETP